MECGLFNVELTIELPNDALSPMRLERVRRSYHLAGFMTMPAIGMNGGVSDLGIVDGVRSLRTTWMPRYVLPRAQATEIPTVPTRSEEHTSELQSLMRTSYADHHSDPHSRAPACPSRRSSELRQYRIDD